jgi:hypothetical protein
VHGGGIYRNTICEQPCIAINQSAEGLLFTAGLRFFMGCQPGNHPVGDVKWQINIEKS